MTMTKHFKRVSPLCVTITSVRRQVLFPPSAPDSSFLDSQAAGGVSGYLSFPQGAAALARAQKAREHEPPGQRRSATDTPEGPVC